MRIIHAQAVIGQTEQGEVVQQLPHTDNTIDLRGMPVLRSGDTLHIEWTVEEIAPSSVSDPMKRIERKFVRELKRCPPL